MIDAFGLLDKAIFGKLVSPPTTEQIEQMIGVSKGKCDDGIYKMIDKATGDIDSKTAALLTHISLIVAALTFLYSAQSGIFKIIIMIELCTYLALAILCLRSIRFTWAYTKYVSPDDGGNHEFARELKKRGDIYKFAAGATIYVTISMISMLIIDGFLELFAGVLK